jgi:outer membrane protein insertion porin family
MCIKSSMLNKIFKLNLIILFIFSSVYAEIINSINVSGNKRLSEQSIILFGKINLNQNYNDEELNTVLKNLYSTNFFKDISLNIKNEVLIIKVVENPIIEELNIVGIKNKRLNEFILEKITLKDRSSYIENIFLNDLNLVKNILKQAGYYFSEIKTTLTTDDVKNSVKLTYDIFLGEKAKISKIVFTGDKKIKDRTLRNLIASEPARPWKFVSQNIYLDSKRIALDKRLLSNHYKNLGYYNSKITNSFVELQDDNSFKLIFNINAGEKIYFNNLSFNIPDDYDPKYFDGIKNLLSKNEGKLYSLEKLNKILNEIDKIALSKQYQFVKASFIEELIGDKINISITLKDSEKVYIERINIFGNNVTLEEVIRHTFLVDEGDPFNEILFNKSINKIKAKNIFKEVKSNISEGSNDSLRNIDIIIEEKPTGEISLGAGVGTSGATIGGGIKENNFLGKGIMLDTSLTISENSIRGGFVYAKPNYNYSENTLFTSLQSTTTDNLAAFGYKTTDLSTSVGTSFQQYENIIFSPEFAIAFENIEASSTASSALKKQSGDYFDTYFNHSFVQDLRNRSYQPTDGFKNVFAQEIPFIADAYEIGNSFESTAYKKIGNEMVGKLSFYSKAITSMNNKDVRISKRLYLPASKLRGFEKGKIGPTENFDYIGGNYATALNFSTSLPQVLPSLENFDFSYFIDTGNVWGVDYNSSLDNSRLRSSTGVTIDVITPVGPMNFSFSKPITKASTDKTETFRFNLGTTF